jgi:hypothetical protein
MNEDIEVIHAGKRLALEKSGWAGDWFMSSSPRNGNSHAEGQWDQWVDLALKILQHPATEVTRPDAHAAVAALPVHKFYNECGRDLTDPEIAALFPTGV